MINIKFVCFCRIQNFSLKFMIRLIKKNEIFGNRAFFRGLFLSRFAECVATISC